MDWNLILVAALAALAPTIAALRVSRNVSQQRVEMNHRLDELIAAAKLTGDAEGFARGVAEGIATGLATVRARDRKPLRPRGVQ